MRKIPLLILSLFVLGSNFIALPLSAEPGEQVTVTATVLEVLSIRQSEGAIVIESNMDNGFCYSFNNQSYSAEEKIIVTSENKATISVFATF